MSTELITQKDTSELTKAVITVPLRSALEEEGIDEQSCIAVFAEILHDENTPAAVRLNAVKTFMSWIGIVNESKHIDVDVVHRVADALGMLEQRRQARQADPIESKAQPKIEWDSV